MPPDESPAVLYVDDEPINLRVFEANFRTKFRVLTCQSASEALAILGTRAQEIGILISDQRMPNMTGVELLERTREIAPDVQRMVITAYSDMQAVMDAVNRGQVSRYFVKPWVKGSFNPRSNPRCGSTSFSRSCVKLSRGYFNPSGWRRSA